MTKSPRRVAREALRLAQEALPESIRRAMLALIGTALPETPRTLREFAE